MASIENQYVEIRIGLTRADEEALSAMKKDPKELACVAAAAAVAYCEAQQSMLEDNDETCGVGSIVSEKITPEGETKTEIGFFCEKPLCFDQKICANFAGRAAMHEINSNTQFFMPFRRS